MADSLKFIFIPMTYAASLFSMQVPEIHGSLKLFLAVTFALLLSVYIIRMAIRSRHMVRLTDSISYEARSYANFTGSQRIPTGKLFMWAWARCLRPALAIISILGLMGTAIAFLWLSSTSATYKVIVTLYLIVVFAVLCKSVITFDRTKDIFRFWTTERFLDDRHEKRHHPALWKTFLSAFKRNRLWRLVKDRGRISLGALLVVMAPLALLWAQKLDTGLKIGMTICLILMALVTRIAFVGHVVRPVRHGEQIRVSTA